MAEETIKAKLKDITNNKYIIPEINEATTTEPGIVVVDDALSNSSANPVQNKAVKAALDLKANAASLAAKQDKINDLDAIRSGAEKGATALQELPVATTTTLGGVKPDGTTILADSEGVLSATAQVPEGVLTKDSLRAGENIIMTEESTESGEEVFVIAAPQGWTKDNLREGKNIKIEVKTNPYVIDDHTLALWNAESTTTFTEDTVNGYVLTPTNNYIGFSRNTSRKVFGEASIQTTKGDQNYGGAATLISTNVGGDITFDFWLTKTDDWYNRARNLTFNFGSGLHMGFDYDSISIYGGSSSSGYSAKVSCSVRSYNWHHYAFVKDSTNGKLYAYEDGIKKAECLIYADGHDVPAPITLTTASYYEQYAFDEFRISDVARWTEDSFEVPTSAYERSTTSDWYVINHDPDTALSATSKNTVQNKVVKEALDTKLSSTDAASIYLSKTDASATYATKSELTTDLATKQDTLTAGTGITIVNNVISASSTGAPSITFFKGSAIVAGTNTVETGIDFDNYNVVKVYLNGVLLEPDNVESMESTESGEPVNDYYWVGTVLVLRDNLNANDKVTVEVM